MNEETNNNEVVVEVTQAVASVEVTQAVASVEVVDTPTPTAKVTKPKKTKAQLKQAKREANIKCYLANPEKYGKKTVPTSDLLSVIRKQQADLEAEKEKATSHGKNKLSGSLNALADLEKQILEMTIAHYKN